jgi:hypothetical protein
MLDASLGRVCTSHLTRNRQQISQSISIGERFRRMAKRLIFRATIPALLMTVVISAGGCGQGNDNSSIKVDETREKALTDSMRGYYDNENKKETKKEPAAKK